MNLAPTLRQTPAPTTQAQQILYAAYPELAKVWEEYQAGAGEAATQAQVANIFDQAMQVPALRDAFEQEARRQFIEHHKPHLVAGGIGFGLLLWGAYEWGKGSR